MSELRLFGELLMKWASEKQGCHTDKNQETFIFRSIGQMAISVAEQIENNLDNSIFKIQQEKYDVYKKYMEADYEKDRNIYLQYKALEQKLTDLYEMKCRLRVEKEVEKG